MLYRKYICLVALAAMAYSCDSVMPTVPDDYYQPTSDDLSHLYYDQAEVLFAGVPISYKDTILFLANGSDTLSVEVHTVFNYIQNPFSFNDAREGVSGHSSLDFGNRYGLSTAQIYIRKCDSKPCSKQIELSVAEGKTYFERFGSQLDTALVLGRMYQDVYKIYPPEGGQTQLKSIYFAKKFGFIRIERLDGQKLELLRNGS